MFDTRTTLEIYVNAAMYFYTRLKNSKRHFEIAAICSTTHQKIHSLVALSGEMYSFFTRSRTRANLERLLLSSSIRRTPQNLATFDEQTFLARNTTLNYAIERRGPNETDGTHGRLSRSGLQLSLRMKKLSGRIGADFTENSGHQRCSGV